MNDFKMKKNGKKNKNKEIKKRIGKDFEGFCIIQDLQLEKEKNLFIKEWCNKKIKYCYFKGHNWKITSALKAIQKTIEWRKKINIQKITMDTIEPFMKGFDDFPMMYHHGFDASNRPIIWVHLANSRSFLTFPDKNNDNKFNFTIWFVESVRKAMKDKVTSAILIFDMKGFDLKLLFLMNGIIKKFKTFPDHNPEFLYKAYIVNAGPFFSAIFALFDLFLNARTKKKFENFKNLNDLKKVVPSQYLLEQYGGNDSFKYSFCQHFESWKSQQLTSF